MSFREKSAWITLLTTLVCYGVYFGALATGSVTSHGADTFHLFLACSVALIILQIVLNVIAAILNPKEAQTPADEREKLILARSHSWGFYTLVAATLLLAAPVHLTGYSRVDVMNFAMLGLVTASLVVAIAQIVMYRRGA